MAALLQRSTRPLDSGGTVGPVRGPYGGAGGNIVKLSFVTSDLVCSLCYFMAIATLPWVHREFLQPMQAGSLFFSRLCAGSDIDPLCLHVPGLALIAEGIDGASRTDFLQPCTGFASRTPAPPCGACFVGR